MKIASLFNFLFPPVCMSCAADASEPVCARCKDQLVAVVGLNCPVCRRSLPLELLATAQNRRCHPSASHLIISAASYHHPVVQSLIRQLKFKRRTQTAQYLADLLISALKQTHVDFSQYVLVPVPLSPARLRLRGFNQAELLAQMVSRKTHIPVLEALVRVADSVAQSEVATWTQRRVNIAGAYEPMPGVDIAGKNIILIDDVWTSGATLSEATAALRRGKPMAVIALVAARAGA